MADGRGDVDSSDDSSVSSFSDPESWNLHFDLPDNDQTWLYCPKGVDPNSVEDLGEILTASQRVRVSSQPPYSIYFVPYEPKGGVFDSRTFTRPKRQSPNTHNTGPSRTSPLRSKLMQILYSALGEERSKKKNFKFSPNKTKSLESLHIADIKCSDSPNCSIRESISVETLSIDGGCSNYNEVKPHFTVTNYGLHSLLLADYTTPQPVFSDFSLEHQKSNSRIITESVNLISEKNSASDHKRIPLNKNNNERSFFNKNRAKSCSQHVFHELLISHANNSSKSLNSDLHLISSPKRCRVNITEPVQCSCNIKYKELDETYIVEKLAGEAVGKPESKAVRNDAAACVPQRNLKKEETPTKNENRNSSFGQNLTKTLLKNANEPFNFRNDSNTLKKFNELELSDRTLLENVSAPSGFSVELSLGDTPSFTDEISKRVPEPQNSFTPKLRYSNPYKINSSKEKKKQNEGQMSNVKPLAYTSPEERAGFLFNPSLVSTPKSREGRLAKEQIYKGSTTPKSREGRLAKEQIYNVSTIAEEDNVNNNISAKINETFSNNNPKLNTTMTLNDNKGLNDTRIVNNPEGDLLQNVHFPPEKEYVPCKAESVENVNKNLKITKEKDEDSAPDSCYSSSSNIRSLGDVCGIPQPQENVNFATSMRKSISHDSLLSQESFKAPSNIKKHESELSLIPRMSVRGAQTLHKPRTLDEAMSRNSSVYRFSRLSTVKTNGLENFNLNETFRVEDPVKDQIRSSRPSGIKPPKAFSKIPTFRPSKIPTKARSQSQGRKSDSP